MTEHSPLPWKIGNDTSIIYGSDGYLIADCYRPGDGATGEASTALIIERVNGWDALVKERDSLKAERDAADARLIAHNNTARQELRSLLGIRDKLLAERDELRDFVRECADADTWEHDQHADGCACRLCWAKALLVKVRP